MTNKECKKCYNYKFCLELNNIPNDLTVFEHCNFFKDGSLILELPCKVGDEVYEIVQLDEIQQEEVNHTMTHDIYCGETESISIDKKGKVWMNVIYENGLRMYYDASMIRKNVFFSYEEAKKALKETQYEKCRD